MRPGDEIVKTSVYSSGICIKFGFLNILHSRIRRVRVDKQKQPSPIAYEPVEPSPHTLEMLHRGIRGVPAIRNRDHRGSKRAWFDESRCQRHDRSQVAIPLTVKSFAHLPYELPHIHYLILARRSRGHITRDCWQGNRFPARDTSSVVVAQARFRRVVHLISPSPCAVPIHPPHRTELSSALPPPPARRAPPPNIHARSIHNT